jgi:hypothetical protein
VSVSEMRKPSSSAFSRVTRWLNESCPECRIKCQRNNNERSSCETREQVCADCAYRLGVIPTDSGLPEKVCIVCGLASEIQRFSSQADAGSRFGRGPDAALVMDNNLGTAPGPERKRQVMTALNRNGVRNRSFVGDGEVSSDKKQGLEFHLASIDLLTLWKMSGDPTDHAVSEILTATIRFIESKTGRKIKQEKVEAIARSCKTGIKAAEKIKRLTPKEMREAVEQQFRKEGLWQL